MAEYIEREAALDALCKVSVPTFNLAGKPILDVDYVSTINSIPAADVVPMGFHERCLQIEIQKRMALEKADVRPVVLCRDCKWCHAGYCEKYDDLIPFGCANKPWEEWFCADGEKREES